MNNEARIREELKSLETQIKAKKSELIEELSKFENGDIVAIPNGDKFVVSGARLSFGGVEYMGHKIKKNGEPSLREQEIYAGFRGEVKLVEES